MVSLLREALKMGSTIDAYELSKKISDKDIKELNLLKNVMNTVVRSVPNENIKWKMIFKIQFVNETIKFKQGKLKLNL